MSDANTCLISKEKGFLQIPYSDYLSLMEKVQAGQKIRQTRDAVMSNLQKVLESKGAKVTQPVRVDEARPVIKEESPKPEKVEAIAESRSPSKVSVEFEAEQESAAPDAAPTVVAEKPKAVIKRKLSESVDVPPIKADISMHFNREDDSGRLFSVFKQYYTCLNDTCGGTVRVTMKDGFCSLWNYDAWEEFAFIDVFEGHLRVALDPRYTGDLNSLNFCEVPRLLSSRRNLICVQVDDLCNTMLDILVKAFEEVGMATS